MLSLCCFCLCLLRGQDNDLSLVNGVGVHKMVGVALEDGLVLHQTGSCVYLFSPLLFFFQKSFCSLIPCKYGNRRDYQIQNGQNHKKTYICIQKHIKDIKAKV